MATEFTPRYCPEHPDEPNFKTFFLLVQSEIEPKSFSSSAHITNLWATDVVLLVKKYSDNCKQIPVYDGATINSQYKSETNYYGTFLTVTKCTVLVQIRINSIKCHSGARAQVGLERTSESTVDNPSEYQVFCGTFRLQLRLVIN